MVLHLIRTPDPKIRTRCLLNWANGFKVKLTTLFFSKQTIKFKFLYKPQYIILSKTIFFSSRCESWIYRILDFYHIKSWIFIILNPGFLSYWILDLLKLKNGRCFKNTPMIANSSIKMVCRGVITLTTTNTFGTSALDFYIMKLFLK